MSLPKGPEHPIKPSDRFGLGHIQVGNEYNFTWSERGTGEPISDQMQTSIHRNTTFYEIDIGSGEKMFHPVTVLTLPNFSSEDPAFSKTGISWSMRPEVKGTVSLETRFRPAKICQKSGLEQICLQLTNRSLHHGWLVGWLGREWLGFDE